MSFRTNIYKIKNRKTKLRKLRKSCDVFNRMLIQLAYFYLAKSNKSKMPYFILVCIENAQKQYQPGRNE